MKKLMLLSTAFALVGSILLTPSIAHADDARPIAEEHCVIEIIGQRKGGEFITKEEVCFPTFPEALQHMGATAASSEGVTPSSMNLDDFAPLAILGVHYEHSNYSGSSTSTTGGACNGGYINAVPAWNDRISSTLNGCGRIEHREHANLGGARFDTTGAGGSFTGSTMNDKTSSIRYSAS